MDNVDLEKRQAMASFNRFRNIPELLLLFAVVSWSTGRFPAISFADYILKLNHHVVFLIGNTIIFLLFIIFRRTDATVSVGDFYDDYVKYTEAPEPAPAETEGETEESKQLVVRVDESDDAAAAIEKAKRQIEKFRRTQSEKLKREISVRPPAVFRRSETDIYRKTASSVAADIETLSDEEFRRIVDAFIAAQRSGMRKGTKRIEFREHGLLKMA